MQKTSNAKISKQCETIITSAVAKYKVIYTKSSDLQFIKNTQKLPAALKKLVAYPIILLALLKLTKNIKKNLPRLPVPALVNTTVWLVTGVTKLVVVC